LLKQALCRADASSAPTAMTCFRAAGKNGSLMPEDGNYHELPPETVDESKGVKLPSNMFASSRS
jgi:hypothetical protein